MAEPSARKAARRVANSAGYGSMGGHLGRLKDGGSADDIEDKSFVRKGVGQHESRMHPGRGHTKLKLQDGGSTMGEMAPPRHDRQSRSGGGKRDGHAPKVNILIHSAAPAAGGAGADQAGAGAPPPPPRPVVPPPMPPHPPMGGPMPGGMPMGMPPMGAGPGGPLPTGGAGGMPPRPPGMARGGAACADGGDTGPGTHHMTYGSGSGAGRLQKIGRSVPKYQV